MNRGLIACQNCENRVFIDRIVPEKNRVEVTAHLAELLLAVNLGSLVAGYAMGYPSSALLDLEQWSPEYAFEKRSVDSGLFAALVPLGAFLGSPIGGLVSDWMGRKKSLMLAGVPNFVGWCLIVLSPYTGNPAVFKGFILVGRFLSGAATGWMTSPITTYTSEISPPHLRGLFATFYQLGVITGVFFVYAVGAIPDVQYNYSAAVAIGLIITCEVFVAILYRSPRWLLSKGNETAAKKVLVWLRRSEELARQEMKEIMDLIRDTPKLSLKEKLLEFRHKHVYKPLIIAEIVGFIYQFSGTNVVLFYAALVFERAGVMQPRQTAFYSLGVVQIVATILCVVLVDKLGRKVLLIVGSIGIFVSCTGLGTHFFFTQPSLCLNLSNFSDMSISNTSEVISDCNPHLSPLAICTLVVFSFAFSFSWRCLPFILMSELFPLHLRGVLGGINDGTVWLFAGIVTGFYPEFEELVYPYTAWWCFASVALFGLFFVAIFVPETKGKTLEEIELYFRGAAGCTCCVKEKETDLYFKETDLYFKETTV